jgi:putative RNA 2'-phosphotransferase
VLSCGINKGFLVFDKAPLYVYYILLNGSMNIDSKLIRISKFLSLVLRHKPEHIGLTLDDEGWADVAELTKKAHESGVILDRPILRQIVEHAEKKRFSFSEDGKKIRANYGHSIPISLGEKSAAPPEYLFHGTAKRFLPSIESEGLGPGTRQYVHLVEDETTAMDVGRRHGEPVVLMVKAHEMHEKGYEFFKTESAIWLTKEVPAEYVIIEGSQGLKEGSEKVNRGPN